MDEHETINYPTPDPNWDYSTVWEQLHIAKTQIESLVEYLSHVENATQSSDSIVEQRLGEISKNVLNTYNFMPGKVQATIK